MLNIDTVAGCPASVNVLVFAEPLSVIVLNISSIFFFEIKQCILLVKIGQILIHEKFQKYFRDLLVHPNWICPFFKKKIYLLPQNVPIMVELVPL